MPFSNSVQTLSILITSTIIILAANIYLRDTQDLTSSIPPMSSGPLKQALQKTMATLSHAKIIHRTSSSRGHSDHGWLNTYHSFSFASWYDPRYESFGCIRVLNEDRVAPQSGFPTHPHRDAEIFSYIISGELTHRDSTMQKASNENSNKDLFYRMKRGDVQFTTGGSGIAHSEQNEHKADPVHFLQIWALPWKRGLKPIYHTSSFSEAEKRNGFVTMISPLKAGRHASEREEAEARAKVDGTIPVHADLVFSAAIIAPGKVFGYQVGGGEGVVESKLARRVYVHLPMTKEGKARVKIDGRDSVVLSEGDAAFVSEVNAGDVLNFESVGQEEAEIVVLDSN